MNGAVDGICSNLAIVTGEEIGLLKKIKDNDELNRYSN